MLVQLEIPTTVYSGKTTVTTPGTEVLLGITTIKSVTIKALSSNTGLIYVGAGGISSANGFQLSAGDTISMDISSLGIIWLDADNSGEGVTYIAIN